MRDKQRFFGDGVHPNDEGQDFIAAMIYRALTAPTTTSLAEKTIAKQFPEIVVENQRIQITSPLGNDKTVATKFSAHLFSLEGKEIDSWKMTEKHSTHTVINLSAGVYLLRLDSSTHSIAKRLEIAAKK